MDGPFPSLAGPGVLPTFEGCDPYFVWTKFGQSTLPQESLEAIEAALKGRESDVVGVLGFSQGGKLGAGLLLMQQLRDKNTYYPINFEFGVMCMSVTPPLISKEFWDRREERISIPNIHVIGTEDEWYAEGMKLYNDHFEARSSSLLRFDIGHRLPIKDEQNLTIANKIKKVYEEATGKELIEFER